MQGRVVVFANRNCIGENRWSTVAKNTTSRRITGVDAVTYSKRKAINSRNVLCVHGIIVRPSVDEILRFDVITLVSMQSSIGSSRYSTVFSAGAKTASGAVARTSSIPKLNLRLKSVNIRARFYDIPVPELRGCAFLSFYHFHASHSRSNGGGRGKVSRAREGTLLGYFCALFFSKHL